MTALKFDYELISFKTEKKVLIKSSIKADYFTQYLHVLRFLF